MATLHNIQSNLTDFENTAKNAAKPVLLRPRISLHAAASIGRRSTAASRTPLPLPNRTNQRNVRRISLLPRDRAYARSAAKAVMNNSALTGTTTAATLNVSGVLQAQGLNCNRGGLQGSYNGLHYTTQNDVAWGSYRAAGGAARSWTGSTACSDGTITATALRHRCGASSSEGHIFENRNEVCLLSINGATGNTRVKGTLTAQTVNGTNPARAGHRHPPVLDPGRLLQSLNDRSNDHEFRTSVLETGKLVSGIAFSSTEAGSGVFLVNPAVVDPESGTITTPTSIDLMTLDQFSTPMAVLHMDSTGITLSPYLYCDGATIGGDDVSAKFANIDGQLAGLFAGQAANTIADALAFAVQNGFNPLKLIPFKTPLPDGMDAFEIGNEFQESFDHEQMWREARAARFDAVVGKPFGEEDAPGFGFLGLDALQHLAQLLQHLQRLHLMMTTLVVMTMMMKTATTKMKPQHQ